MKIGDSRRVLLWAIAVAAALGFAFGWYARIWYAPSPESRARQKAEELRERVHELTH